MLQEFWKEDPHKPNVKSVAGWSSQWCSEGGATWWWWIRMMCDPMWTVWSRSRNFDKKRSGNHPKTHAVFRASLGSTSGICGTCHQSLGFLLQGQLLRIFFETKKVYSMQMLYVLLSSRCIWADKEAQNLQGVQSYKLLNILKKQKQKQEGESGGISHTQSSSAIHDRRDFYRFLPNLSWVTKKKQLDRRSWVGSEMGRVLSSDTWESLDL